ncbi:MAG: hypothetical protein LBK52_01360, partial [Deltaproteobacteria bacterium]|nr:hypothetical protein [Deltaproteobacteria bacterium]
MADSPQKTEAIDDWDSLPLDPEADDWDSEPLVPVSIPPEPAEPAPDSALEPAPAESLSSLSPEDSFSAEAGGEPDWNFPAAPGPEEAEAEDEFLDISPLEADESQEALEALD